MNIYPYVYRLDHPTTGEFYIGYRSANKVPASIDLGKYYFTSSEYIKSRFSEFNYQVIAEFFDKNDAYDFEQQTIFENFNNSLLLNKHCLYGKNRFIRSKESIEKQRGKTPANITIVGIVESLVKQTGAVLNISNNTPKSISEYRKYVSLGEYFKIRFNTEEERLLFLEYNKEYTKGILKSNTKLKIGISLKGKPKPPRSKEHIENFKNSYPKTNANKNKPKTEEHKRKLSKYNSSHLWFNNGTINKRLNIHEPISEEWIRGRLKNV